MTDRGTRTKIRIGAIEPEVVLAARDVRVIDLRAPSEFLEDHLPGAINVPLFDDATRALVGTLYAKTSPDAAFDEGRRQTRSHVRALVEAIAAATGWRPASGEPEELVDELTRGGIAEMEAQLEVETLGQLPPHAVVLHCWRGGLRSRSVAALVQRLGLEHAVVLRGGYKAFRACIAQRIASWSPPPAIVLRGLTGVGKTLVLRELERQRPRWTLDLEELAQHRSSILGGVGLEPTTQRRFESRLVARIAAGFERALVVEGESRRVGDVILPPPLWRALDRGTSVELVAPLEHRVDVLVADYLAHPRSRAELREPLEYLAERLGEPRETFVSLLERGEERELVAQLLERWYDPRYRHGEQGRRFAATFDASDAARCAAELADWVENDFDRG